MEQLIKIVSVQIGHLSKRLEEKNIKIELTDDVERHIAEIGYDPVYGARPLKRTIQRYVQDPLASKLLEGEFTEGDTVCVKLEENKTLSFSKKG